MKARGGRTALAVGAPGADPVRRGKLSVTGVVADAVAVEEPVARAAAKTSSAVRVQGLVAGPAAAGVRLHAPALAPALCSGGPSAIGACCC